MLTSKMRERGESGFEEITHW